MRTINRPGRYATAERMSATGGKPMLRRDACKDATDGWRSRSPRFLPPDGCVARLLERCVEAGAIALPGLPSDKRLRTFPQGPEQPGFWTPALHDTAISYVTSCRTDRRLIYVSEQIRRLGFSPEGVLNSLDVRLERLHEEDLQRFESAFRCSCDTGQQFSCQYRLYDERGRIRWFHDEAEVVSDAAGGAICMRGSMLDVTDSKQMESELAECRYNIERQVERRTEQLERRLALLESCNAVLCERLSDALLQLAGLTHQLQQAELGGTK